MKLHTEQFLLLPIALLSTSALASAQITTRASVASSNAQANFASYQPSLSADGLTVAFTSQASNLDAADTNLFFGDVFVRDISLGTTRCVSLTPGGFSGNGDSYAPSLSADGLRVAFVSNASDLVTDNNANTDVFLRDLGASTFERISVNSSGVEGDDYSASASISPDGRYVVFASEATNLDLVQADTNVAFDVFLRDTQLATTTRVSVRNPGSGSPIQCDGDCWAPAVASNGAFVVFDSLATNLTATADINGFSDIYLWSPPASLQRITYGNGGVESNGDSYGPVISADGRYVAFESSATNLLPPFTITDTNGMSDIYVWDRVTNTFDCASRGFLWWQTGDSESVRSSISPDGRFVGFASFATNMYPGDTNGVWDAFVYDRTTKRSFRVSEPTPTGNGNGPSASSARPSLSLDAHYVAFDSVASNLLPGGADSNLASDIFVRQTNGYAPVVYCTAGTTSSGCVATMSAVGNPSASATSGFWLTATNVEAQKFGFVFYSALGRWNLPYGNSYLCMHLPIKGKNSPINSGGTLGNCDGVLSLDWCAYNSVNPWVSYPDYGLTAGRTIDAQAWFRDPPAPMTSNLSDAIEFVLTP